MEAVVLHSSSKTDIKLLVELAKKIGITVKYLSEEDKEDIGLSNAIKKGRTGQLVETSSFLKKLRK